MSVDAAGTGCGKEQRAGNEKGPQAVKLAALELLSDANRHIGISSPSHIMLTLAISFSPGEII